MLLSCSDDMTVRQWRCGDGECPPPPQLVLLARQPMYRPELFACASNKRVLAK